MKLFRNSTQIRHFLKKPIYPHCYPAYFFKKFRKIPKLSHGRHHATPLTCLVDVACALLCALKMNLYTGHLFPFLLFFLCFFPSYHFLGKRHARYLTSRILIYFKRRMITYKFKDQLPSCPHYTACNTK